MKSFAIATVALAAGANAWNNATYTTQVVTSYTTYCPGPTSVVIGQKTYTVTKATTLTITDCPCTITKPVIPTLPTAVPVKSSAVVVPVVPVVKTTTLAGGSVVVTTVTPPAVPVSTAVVVPAVTPVYSVPVVKGTSAPSAVPVTPTTPSAPIFTGAGNKAAASGLSLAGLAAVAAFFL